MNRLFTFIATALIFWAGNLTKVKAEIMNKEIQLVQDWDKTFPKSEKVNHEKVTFNTQYGLTLAADLYIPKNAEGKLPAIAVSGPFGAVKEQCSGLYAQTMAERGFITIAFDPSFTGESSGEPRRTASPDINTEDFLAAVDYLSMRDDVDAGRIAIIGICGWGGIALNAAAQDPRIKATAAITMYDMSRVSGNGYFDADDSEEKRYSVRKAWAEARTADLKNRTFTMAGGVVDPLPENAPQFVKDYYAYYKTPRGFHNRSGNSNHVCPTTGCQPSANTRFLYTTNRLVDDGISILAVDKESGRLNKIGYQPTGIHPRNFNISPSCRFLLCACRDSGVIQVFLIDSASGLLHDIHQDI